MNEEQQAAMQADNNPQYSSASLSIISVTADTMVCAYDAMSGSMPGAFGDFVTVFAAEPPLFPFNGNAEPAAFAQITGSPQGNIVLKGNFQRGVSYMAGYSVGPRMAAPAQMYGNVCATVAVSPGGSSTAVAVTSSIRIMSLTATTLAVNYRLPEGLIPGRNGAWMGVWQGTVPYYAVPPAFAVPVSSLQPEGNVVFNNITMLRGTLYGIGLYMSGWTGDAGTSVRTALACTAVVTL